MFNCGNGYFSYSVWKKFAYNREFTLKRSGAYHHTLSHNIDEKFVLNKFIIRLFGLRFQLSRL